MSQIFRKENHGPVWKRMIFGSLGQCPNCQKDHIFSGYLTVNHHCRECGLGFYKHRADDLPPYITISIVGHIVIPLMLLVEKLWAPDMLLQAIGWAIVAMGLILWMLPKVKGAMIALQWTMGMHGFDQNDLHPIDKAPDENQTAAPSSSH